MDEHANYPHHPGTLHGCFTCETQCYCDGDYECINCTISQECEHDEC